MNYICNYDKLVSPGELTPHPKNPNKHPQKQIERLAGILKYQGFRSPIIVSNQTGLVIAGHARLEAAKLLQLTQVPVNYQDFKDIDQEYAHMTADNAIADWAELDLASINQLVPDLGPDFDIDMMGLENFEIDAFEKTSKKESEIEGSKEYEEEDFNKFNAKCPRCNFEFNT